MYDNHKAFKKELGGNKSLAPFGWVGGKSKLAPWLVTLIPEHTQYVEVFGGALNLLWAKKRSKLEVINDFDGELVNLYRVIKSNPHTLSDRLEELWFSREIFNLLKFKQISARGNNKIERAAHTYFGITASFSGKRTHFGRAKLPQSGQSRNQASRLHRDFTVWSRRLKYTQIENLSFEQMLKDYDHEASFFYLDPPYYDCETYYLSAFTKESHECLATMLKDVKGKWLLSYNDHPVIRELYKDYEIISTPEILYSMRGFGTPKKVKEIVIANYDLKEYLHEASSHP